MKQNIDPNDIEIKFGGGSPPKDEYMIDLLKGAYKHEFMVNIAIIKAEGIVPFSKFKPKLTQDHFDTYAKNDNPIYVYPKDGKFIMSDDYFSYYAKKAVNVEKFLCIVLGEASGDYVIEKSTPFYLPPPTYEINE